MLTSNECEPLLRASYLDHKLIGHSARSEGRSRRAVDQAITAVPPTTSHHADTGADCRVISGTD